MKTSTALLAFVVVIVVVVGSVADAASKELTNGELCTAWNSLFIDEEAKLRKGGFYETLQGLVTEVLSLTQEQPIYPGNCKKSTKEEVADLKNSAAHLLEQDRTSKAVSPSEAQRRVQKLMAKDGYRPEGGRSERYQFLIDTMIQRMSKVTHPGLIAARDDVLPALSGRYLSLVRLAHKTSTAMSPDWSSFSLRSLMHEWRSQDPQRWVSEINAADSAVNEWCGDQPLEDL